MLTRLAKVAMFAALLLVAWVAFESFVSWAAFCNYPEEYGRSYQSPEEYGCIFRGPVVSLAAAFSNWWRRVFHQPDAYVALFTAVLAVSTIALWYSTQRLWKAGEAHSQRQLRAYIVIDIAEVELPKMPPREYFSIRITVKNTGQTPAYKVHTSGITKLIKYPFPPMFDFSVPIGDDPSEAMVGPGQTTEAESQSDPMTIEESARITSGRTKGEQLCTWGTVFYTDVFDAPQYTNYCVRHLFENVGRATRIVTHACKEHNDAS